MTKKELSRRSLLKELSGLQIYPIDEINDEILHENLNGKNLFILSLKLLGN